MQRKVALKAMRCACWPVLVAVVLSLILTAAPVWARGGSLKQYQFTRIEDANLHYFGIGDQLTVNGAGASAGSLLIVGGALKPDNATIYNRFIDLAGDQAAARIAIIPTASGSPVKNASAMKSDLLGYGVPEDKIYIAPIATEDDDSTPDVDESTWSENGFSEEIAQSLDGYTAVWFIGGWQNRITAALLHEDGTDGPVMTKIREIYANGGVIGGTSAGAAVMSATMISGGTSLGALTREIVHEDFGESDSRLYIEKGLGLFEFGIVDQHFIARGRFGRLMAACVNLDIPMGFGIDENSAMEVQGNTIQVIGEEASRSGLVVVDIPGNGLNGFTVDSRRLSTTGYEYFDGNELHTAIFAANALVDTICEGLVDNTATTAEGMAFEMAKARLGVGVRVTFKEKEATEGFYEKIGGVYTYSAVNIGVSVEPIKLRIRTLPVR